MKLTTFLLTLSILQIAASSFSQTEKLTFALKDAPVISLFQMIEQQSGFRFLYRNETVENKTVSINAKNLPVEAVLKQTLGKAEIDYTILENNLIVITPTNNPFISQQLQVSGVVTSGTDGMPLPGVNVVEKGTQNGTITNVSGEYIINITGPQSILVFSFIGYLTEEIVVNEQTNINLVMAEDIQKLDEVVVIGYGTQKKSDLTGAITSVRAEDLEKTNSASIMTALQGKAAGVQITPSTGMPGSETMIRVRGISSISQISNDHAARQKILWIVDGVPMDSK